MRLAISKALLTAQERPAYKLTRLKGYYRGARQLENDSGRKNGDTNHNAIVREIAMTNTRSAMLSAFTVRSFRSVPPSIESTICCLNGDVINNPIAPNKEMAWKILATALIPGLIHAERTIVESYIIRTTISDQTSSIRSRRVLYLLLAIFLQSRICAFHSVGFLTYANFSSLPSVEAVNTLT